MTLKPWFYAVDDLYQQDKDKFIKLVELKADIVTNVMEFEAGNYMSCCVMGFNPILWKLCKDYPNFEYNMVCYDDQEVAFAKQHEDLQHINCYTADEIEPKGQFDMVLALDSYFTRFGTEQAQKDAIALAHGLTNNVLVTTIKDFKNIKSIDRLIDPPMVINSRSDSHVFVCHREWNTQDKQRFTEIMYQLSNGEMKSFTKEDKRTLYFKQLAKYVHDLGCSSFKISQTQFYKNLFSRSYEYIAVAHKK